MKTAASIRRGRSTSLAPVVPHPSHTGVDHERPYTLTTEDKKLIGDLLLDLATELDIHYDDEDFHALVPSFALITRAVALLERAAFDVPSGVREIVGRFNKSRQ